MMMSCIYDDEVWTSVLSLFFSECSNTIELCSLKIHILAFQHYLSNETNLMTNEDSCDNILNTEAEPALQMQ